MRKIKLIFFMALFLSLSVFQSCENESVTANESAVEANSELVPKSGEPVPTTSWKLQSDLIGVDNSGEVPCVHFQIRLYLIIDGTQYLWYQAQMSSGDCVPTIPGSGSGGKQTYDYNGDTVEHDFMPQGKKISEGFDNEPGLYEMYKVERDRLIDEAK